MGIEYRLGTRESGTLEISCDEKKKAIVKSMSIHGFGDCISFEKRNTDGSTFGSHWGIHSLGCFEEMKQAYGRLMEMPEKAVRKLAVRIYEMLYTQHARSPLYNKTPPEINKKDQRFRQILEELTALQAKEKRLVNSGKLTFPSISQKELASMDLW